MRNLIFTLLAATIVRTRQRASTSFLKTSTKMAVSISAIKTYNRESELKAFDDSKAGIKGLVDSGITQIPRIFHNNRETTPVPTGNSVTIPTIDLQGVENDQGRRRAVAIEVGEAAEKFGFFQVVNHGVAERFLEEMKNGVRRFNEQETEKKKEFYTRDLAKPFVYNSNFDLFTAPAARWRDTFHYAASPRLPNPESFPSVSREILVEYPKHVIKLGSLLLELLSEALGLGTYHLKDMGCAEGLLILGHYYPPCPQPHLTLGATEHADDDVITILLQDQLGGLQVLLNNEWIDVPPVPGALVINVGDFLQLITNDRLKSVEHRVLANNHTVPRISVACFFSTNTEESSRMFGPIKELLSEDNPPKYKQISVSEYRTYLYSKGLNGVSTLLHFRI